MKRHAFYLIVAALSHLGVMADPMLQEVDRPLPPLKRSPWNSIQYFWGTLVPFTLGTDEVCRANWECLGEVDTSRDSCGTEADPCAVRIRGDVGDSIFLFNLPGYPKRHALDMHICGVAYELQYGTETDPKSIHVSIVDIQPGYMTVSTFDPPESSPWEHLKDSWMQDHWDKRAEVHNYVEIEAAGWAKLDLDVSPPAWTAPCKSPIDFTLPENLPEPVPFYAELRAHNSDHRMHNFDLEYTAHSLVRWANYMRAIFGVPPMLKYDPHLSEASRENAELVGSGNRGSSSDGWVERQAFCSPKPDGTKYGRLHETRDSHRCANCARTTVKYNTRSNSAMYQWMHPYTYMGVACENRRNSREIERFCNIIFGTVDLSDNNANWAPLYWTDEAWNWPDLEEDYTSTTTKKPTCEEKWTHDGWSFQILMDTNQQGEEYYEAWLGAWKSVLSHFQWWLPPLEDDIEVDMYPWMKFWCSSLHIFEDKNTAPVGSSSHRCHRVIRSTGFHNRDAIIEGMSSLTFRPNFEGDDRNSVLDALRRASSTWLGWGMDVTQLVYVMSDYHENQTFPDWDQPWNETGDCHDHDYPEMVAIHNANVNREDKQSPVHVVFLTKPELLARYTDLAEQLISVGRRSMAYAIENDVESITKTIWQVGRDVRCWCDDRAGQCPVLGPDM